MVKPVSKDEWIRLARETLTLALADLGEHNDFVNGELHDKIGAVLSLSVESSGEGWKIRNTRDGTYRLKGSRDYYSSAGHVWSKKGYALSAHGCSQLLVCTDRWGRVTAQNLRPDWRERIRAEYGHLELIELVSGKKYNVAEEFIRIWEGKLP